MKGIFNTILTAAVIATAVSAQAAVVSQSKEVVVETPADLPEAAQVATEGIYLHDIGDGRTYLYLEQNDGKELAILDVTDPAQIKPVTRVSITATSPFDFMQRVGDRAVLIRYRDHSGFATLDLTHARNPVLGVAPPTMYAGITKTLGQTALLTSTQASFEAPQAAAHMYQVVDMSKPSQPTLLFTVTGVKQSVSEQDTGTLFLLGDAGVTAVRQPRVEQEHRIELMQQIGN